MGKKSKKSGGPKMVLPGWMASYADMFTVLMVFFVLLFSMSQIDQELFERFIISFNPARADDFMVLPGGGGMLIDAGPALLPDLVPPIPPGTPGYEEGTGEDGIGGDIGLEGQGDAVGDMYNVFMTYMADLIDAGDWDGYLVPEIIQGEDHISIIFDSADEGNTMFPPGEHDLTRDAQELLLLLGPTLEELSAQGHGIIVEGHTDNVYHPRGGNWLLSSMRATTVVEFLVNNAGIDPTLITPVGRGEYHPRDLNDTPEGRARNRRVEIHVFTTEVTEATGRTGGRWFEIPGTR